MDFARGTPAELPQVSTAAQTLIRRFGDQVALPAWARPTSRRTAVAIAVAVGALAFALRLRFALNGGGLLGIGTYDDGVHFSAAAALVHGRLPYRDFLFLQPPGILLVLAPFAWLGGIIGDAHAFEAARLAFMAIGGANAALVALCLRRYGAGAALIGGAFYAAFPPAIYAEHTTILEPLGTLGLLVALLLFTAPPLALAGTRGAAILGGIALGGAVGVKIWYIVPALIVVVLARRRILAALAAATATVVVVYGVFFVAAPSAMWREVVVDQLGRPRMASSVSRRIGAILAAPGAGHAHTLGLTSQQWALVAAFAALVCGVVALTIAGARAYAVLLAVSTGLLLASPSFFAHYTLLTAYALALVVGVVAGRLLALVSARVLRTALTAVAVLVVVAGVREANALSTSYRSTWIRPPVAGLQHAAAAVHGCVMSDDPTALIVMNVLTRNLNEHCALWPDVTGWTYDRDDVKVNGATVARAENARWQQHVTEYLLSGAAVLPIRSGTGLSAESKATLTAGTVLFSHGPFRLFATTGTGGAG